MKPNEFWPLCPAETFEWLKAARVGASEEIKQLSWLIGHYTAYAYHDVKNYPRSPDPKENNRAQNPDEMRAILRQAASTQ
jgi:hypothetical protein